MQKRMRNRVKRTRARVKSRIASRKLRRLARGEAPIVAGPWLGPPGFELLYWIPMLNWLIEEAGVDRSRVVAISRAGADPWYADVAGRYVDALDYVPAEKLQRLAELSAPHEQVKDLERRLFRVALEESDPAEAEWLHPRLLHELFSPRWDWADGGGVARAHTVQRQLPDDGSRWTGMEQPYVAVHSAFGQWFPDVPDNGAALERLIGELESRAGVALLPDVVGSVPERKKLTLFTQVIRGADLLISTDFDLAYLGAYVGTPTIALYSRVGFKVVHYDEIDRVGRLLADGGRLFRGRHIGHLAAAAP
jgi:hypothetical protein